MNSELPTTDTNVSKIKQTVNTIEDTFLSKSSFFEIGWSAKIMQSVSSSHGIKSQVEIIDESDMLLKNLLGDSNEKMFLIHTNHFVLVNCMK